MPSSKGVSANLMKSSAKRRRTKIEILEERALAEQQQQRVEEKLAAYAAMEAELARAKQQVAEADVVREHVSGMFDDGLLKLADDGQGYQVVDNPAER